MKLTKKELKEFILSEARKFAVENNWIKTEKEIQFETTIPKNTKTITEESKKETKEAKKLGEELKRMKQLLDFRNPLLGEKK